MDTALPNFPSSNPNHSRFVAILSVIVIIVFCFLGYVIYLYVTTSNSIKQVASQPMNEVVLSDTQRTQIVADLKNATDNAPQLSSTDRSQIITNLKQNYTQN